MPPGLYEAVFTETTADAANPELITGKWIMRCEARTLDDIRALGGNDAEDERKFATAARISETNLALYRTFAQPFIRSMTNPQVAEWMQTMHPLRLQYELFSDANPFMKFVASTAEQVRQQRKPADKKNPFLDIQEAASRRIVDALDGWRRASETFAERAFHAIYGSPALQAAFGTDQQSNRSARRIGKSPLHKRLVEAKIAELTSKMETGGLREALVRAALYVATARQSVDERGFEIVRRIREAEIDSARLSLPEFKMLIREQFFMLLLDQESALAAIPALLPDDTNERERAIDILKEMTDARGDMTDEVKKRLEQMIDLFGTGKPRRDKSKANVSRMAPRDDPKRSRPPIAS